jgi:polyphosphate kinase 2
MLCADKDQRAKDQRMGKKKDKKAKKDGKTAKALDATKAAKLELPAGEGAPKLKLTNNEGPDSEYFEHLRLLQIELVKLQRHWIEEGAKTLIILEGRDAAGKDGALKAITEHMSPRQTRVVALPKPNERDRISWYFQRYIEHLPAGGETVFFNRSWYNRAGVEPVMGFCTPEEHDAFLDVVPDVERVLVRCGTQIIKFYMDLSKAEQAERLADRQKDPLDFWKVGPIDSAAQDKWDDYTQRRNEMLLSTHAKHAPWTIVRANRKKRARLAMLAYLLQIHDYPGKDQALALTDPAVVFGFEPAALKDGRLAP